MPCGHGGCRRLQSRAYVDLVNILTPCKKECLQFVYRHDEDQAAALGFRPDYRGLVSARAFERSDVSVIISDDNLPATKNSGKARERWFDKNVFPQLPSKLLISMTNDLDLVSNDLAYRTDLDRAGHTLLVTFGGLNHGISMPRHEFLNITERLPAKRMFIRDSSQCWYQSRLNGLGRGIGPIVQKIEDVKTSADCEKTVCIGNSMGGYAALLVGNLISADSVIAFAPQSFLNRRLRFLYWDRRWTGKIKKLHSVEYLDSRFLDLKPELENQRYRRADIYVDFDSRLDAIHARRLEALDRTYIHNRKGGHFDLVKNMRDSGELEKLLFDACV